MKKHQAPFILIFLGTVIGFLLLFPCSNAERKINTTAMVKEIKLPEPEYRSDNSIEKCLLERRSIREYKDEPLTLKEVAQLLWAAQGTNRREGYRTAPSAGALYPLEVYLVAGEVNGLEPGIYRYRTEKHALEQILEGDRRKELCLAALSQDCVKNCPALLVITAIYERSSVKYGQRGIQYAHIEVGNTSQNVYLQAISLNMGTVFVGAFYDDKVQAIMHLEKNEIPCCIMPLGKIKLESSK